VFFSYSRCSSLQPSARKKRNTDIQREGGRQRTGKITSKGAKPKQREEKEIGPRSIGEGEILCGRRAAPNHGHGEKGGEDKRLFLDSKKKVCVIVEIKNKKGVEGKRD